MSLCGKTLIFPQKHDCHILFYFSLNADVKIHTLNTDLDVVNFVHKPREATEYFIFLSHQEKITKSE